MITNYLKTAWRNLVRNKTFSLINIIGLAVGFTCFMLIGAWVVGELNYDKYPREAKKIYRVMLSTTNNGDMAVYPNVDGAVGQGMKDAFPEVQAAARVTKSRDFVKYENRQFKENRLAFADSNFLQLFSIPFIEGNPSTALVRPNTVVISAELAKRYFGSGDPIGKMLSIGIRGGIFEVTGVYDQFPDQSHMHFDAVISLATRGSGGGTWSNIGYYTYLQLKDDTDPKKLEAKFPKLVEKFVVPEIQHDMGVSATEASKAVKTFIFSLQPLQDIHLQSHTKYELEPGGDSQYVYIFTGLAVFILLLAIVNFTNLSTARAMKRAKEAGIRKVVGSGRKQIITAFLTESTLVALLSMIIAYAMIFLLLPYFNQLTGRNVAFGFFIDYRLVGTLVLIIFVTGILAGIHPALFLTSLNAIAVLKGGAVPAAMPKRTLRSGLVVFQFFISTSLIIATIIVYQQLNYMQNKKLGFDKEQVIFLGDARLLGENQLAYAQQVRQDSRVVSASVSRSMPGNDFIGGTEIFPKNESSNGETIHANIYRVDDQYVPTLGITVISGRNFSKEFSTDSSAVVINESAARELGWKTNDAVGKTIIGSGQMEYKVIGVVGDFHYASAKEKVAPLMMLLGGNAGGLLIKTKAADINELLTDLKENWDRFSPAGPFEYTFLDETYAALYKGEQITRQLFTVFAVLAVLLASLGLFGLSAFMIERRTREIGIRKVLGASVSNLLALVSREFLLLVLVAFVVAVPVTWWMMNSWLQDFAYRVQIRAWVFIAAGCSSLVLAMLTISFRAIRAAIMNPVKSLRVE